MHQSLVNSLLYELELGPISGEGFDEKIFELLTEIPRYYGPNATCEGFINFPLEDGRQPVTMNTEQGIVVGNADEGGLDINLRLYCAADNTTQKEYWI